MNELLDIPQLLKLRKLTRSVSEKLEADLKRHLATLGPLFSPLPIFGDHIRGGSKAPIKGADKAFHELQSRFKKVATARPFVLDSDIQAPLDLFAAAPSLTPVQYPYQARDNSRTAEVSITAPLRWVLSYPDVAPGNIRVLLGGKKSQVLEELRHCLLQNLALQLTLEKQPGLVAIIRDLRYTVETTQIEGLGELPVIEVSCPISTQLPPDPVIIQNTEITGVPSFEEVIATDDIRTMQDPFKEAILRIAERDSPEVFAELASS